MDKMIMIKVGVEKSKLATAIETGGYDDNSMSDQLELLGVMVNMQWIIQQRIIKLAGHKSLNR